jgi:hypothetical protein
MRPMRSQEPLMKSCRNRFLTPYRPHALKRLMQPGDELWTFRSPQEEWDRHMGWQGLVLVRGGKLVEVIVMDQN